MIGFFIFVGVVVWVGRRSWFVDYVAGGALLGGLLALVNGDWLLSLTGLLLFVWAGWSMSRA